MDLGNSLVVQWLGLCTLTAKGIGSVPCWGTKIPQAMHHKQKKKKEKKKGHGSKGLQNLLSLYKYTLKFPCICSGSLHFLKKQRVFIFQPLSAQVWKLASQR